MPFLLICRDIEQFFLYLASVYNQKILNAQAVTKQELRKYQVEENTTYQNDSLRKRTIRRLFAKSDSLVNKLFVLSSYKALDFATFVIGWCRTWSLFSECL